MSFDEYGLSPEILSGLADVRIDEPTPLQNEVLPSALQGKHMLVKNDADDEGTFLIPALQKIAQNGEEGGIQVLILTPSVERAQKIDETIWAMGYHAQISSALLHMKGKKDEQEKAVLDGAPVVVANPGRLIEILEKNNFHLQDLKLIVIDEAHNMENFNLVSRVKDILRFVKGEPQTLIISGKDNNATRQLAKAALKNPELVGFDTSDEADKSSDDEPKEVDLEAAKEKLEEASVEVVLNPDQKEEEKEEATEEKEKAESKSESDPDSGEAEVDLQKAEEKLKEVSVKVVLKKDLPEEPESKDQEEETDEDNGQEQEKGAVEPVLANPVLQGEKDILPDPVPKNLEQGYINVPPRMKISTLMAHLEQSKAKKVMVFAASKRTTDRLFRIIRKKNWGVVSISDDLDENTYNERFAKFTSGQMRVLLVGGLAAKDVEIEEVEEVINYDVPSEVEEYKYRAELVGQGKATQIISLVSKMDRDDIKKITDQIGYPPTELPLPEELEEKKKGKKKNNGNKSSNKKSGNNNNNRNNQRNNRGGKNSNKRGGRPDKKRVKPKKLELPRPTYDGLSGGRDGNKKENSGIFGWVKKLFD